MSFHAPVKALKPVDINLPDHQVKGAVVVDAQLAEWNKAAVISINTLPSTFILIDRKKDTIMDLTKRIAQELRLPDGHEYGLIADNPKRFITDKTLNDVENGFMLTITASPANYVERIKSILNSSQDIGEMEMALAKLGEFAMDSTLIEVFYRDASMDVLFNMIKRDRVCMSPNLLSSCLHTVASILDERIADVGWESMPREVVAAVTALVTGKAKHEETSPSLVALQMIEQLVTSNATTREWVLDEVPIETLIRHVEKSDERVALAALSLMNSMIENSYDGGKQKEMIDALNGVPFRNAVNSSLLRSGKPRDKIVADELAKVQRALISSMDTSPPTDEDVLRVLNIETVDEQKDEWRESIMHHSCGKLASTAIIRFAERYPQDLRTLVSENTMRTEGGKWQLIPLFLRSIDIVAELFGICGSNDSVEQLVALLFSSEDAFDDLFVCTVQVFHRTWREMQAKEAEIDKVSKVVYEQMKQVINSHSHRDVESLSAELESLSYWEMQEIWRRQQAERENDQLLSRNVRELGDKLRPKMMEIVKVNYRNSMKKGSVFQRHGKGKHMSKYSHWFWKLDNSEKMLSLTPTEGDTEEVENRKCSETRQVWLKDVEDLTSSEELDRKSSSSRFGSSAGASLMVRVIRMTMRDGEVLTALTSDDRKSSIWFEGLSQLIGKNECRSMEALVDRMLKMELRIRLMDIDSPNDMEKPVVPAIPKNIENIVVNV